MAENFPPPPPVEPAVEQLQPLPWEQPGYPFLEGLFETAKLILTRPGEAFSRMPVAGDLGRPLLYAVIFGWLGVIAQQLYSLVLRDTIWRWVPNANKEMFAFPLAWTIAAMVFGPILVLIGVFLWSAILHLILVILGAARNGFAGTVRVVCYASTTQVLQVVPFCGGVIAWIWNVVLEIIGLATAHRTTQANAAVAVLLPFALCCACAVLAAVLFGAAIAGAVANWR